MGPTRSDGECGAVGKSDSSVLGFEFRVWANLGYDDPPAETITVSSSRVMYSDQHQDCVPSERDALSRLGKDAVSSHFLS
jgi:hypothetical protein